MLLFFSISGKLIQTNEKLESWWTPSSAKKLCVRACVCETERVRVCVKERESACVRVCLRERERHGERKKTFFLTRFVDGIIKFPWNRGGEREDWFILFGSGGLKKISLHRKDISQDDGETRGRRSRRADKGSALPDFFSTSSRRPTFEECFQSNHFWWRFHLEHK